MGKKQFSRKLMTLGTVLIVIFSQIDMLAMVALAETTSKTETTAPIEGTEESTVTKVPKVEEPKQETVTPTIENEPEVVIPEAADEELETGEEDALIRSEFERSTGNQTTFNGKPMNEDVVFGLEDMRMGNTHIVEYNSTFSDGNSPKKITITIDSFFNYLKVPGLNMSTMKFDQSLLEGDDLNGIIQDIKFTRAAALFPTDQVAKAGTLEITIAPATLEVTIPFFLEANMQKLVNEGGITFVDSVKIETVANNELQESVSLNNLIYPHSVDIYGTTSGIYGYTSYFEQKNLLNNVTAPVTIGSSTQGVNVADRTRRQFAKTFEIPIKYSKQLEIIGLSYGGIADTSLEINPDIAEIEYDTKPEDDKYKYATVKLNNVQAIASNAYRFRYNVIDSVADGQKLTI